MKGEITVTYKGLMLHQSNIWFIMILSVLCNSQLHLSAEAIENMELFIDGEKIEKPGEMFLDE